MKKRIIAFMLAVILVVGGIAFTPTAARAEGNEFEIYLETQAKIDEAVAMNENNANYINESIELFESSPGMTAERLNQLIVEAADSAMDLDITTQEKKEAAEEALEAMIEKKDPRKRDGIEDGDYNMALSAYKAGILIIKGLKCPQTAIYMNHAIVPVDKIKNADYKIDDVYHHNDEWSQELISNSNFQDKVLAEIKADGKTEGVLDKNGFIYDTDTVGATMDQHFSLHEVDYTVSYKKTVRGYSVKYKITDVFDYKFDTFDSKIVEFANNYCAAMLLTGGIKSYAIEINATNEIWDFEVSEDEIAIPVNGYTISNGESLRQEYLYIVDKNSLYAMHYSRTKDKFGNARFAIYSTMPFKYRVVSHQRNGHDPMIYEREAPYDKGAGLYGWGMAFSEIDDLGPQYWDSEQKVIDYANGKIGLEEAESNTIQRNGNAIRYGNITTSYSINVDFDSNARNAIIATTDNRFFVYSSAPFAVQEIACEAESGVYKTFRSFNSTHYKTGGYYYAFGHAYTNFECDTDYWTSETEARKYVKGN